MQTATRSRMGVDALCARFLFLSAASGWDTRFPSGQSCQCPQPPLARHSHTDPVAAHLFNESARRLWVPLPELKEAIANFQFHATTNRPRERDHPLVHREVSLRDVPPLVSRPVLPDRRAMVQWTRSSPMFAVDATFIALAQANPHLRPRVGNPDEMRSNRLLKTPDALKFRVTDPELGIPEDVHGAVITALNEEAVASAALANKGGINLMHTYEPFGTKMHGVLRQEVIFTNHCREAGRRQSSPPPGRWPARLPPGAVCARGWCARKCRSPRRRGAVPPRPCRPAHGGLSRRHH